MQGQRVVEREQAADVRVVGVGLQAQRDQVGCGAHLDGGSAAGLLQLQQLQAHTYACSSSGIVRRIVFLNRTHAASFSPYQNADSARRARVQVVRG